MSLTHIDKDGSAVMVDVGEKNITHREAEAMATLTMKEETLKAIKSADLKKGDALSCARIAGIMGAKKTFELIPLCHNIPIDSVKIYFSDNGKDELYIKSHLNCTYKTGIEMEALTSVSVAALTVYDMCKAIDRGMTVKDIHLIKKSGGKSDWQNER